MLTPDPRILYPLVCRITAPGGLVDLAARLPRRGGVTLQHVPPEEVQEFADENGTTFTRVTEAGTDCPPPDMQNSETVTTETVVKADGSSTTKVTTVKKIVNPDGSVTTETTVAQDGDSSTNTRRDAEPGRRSGVALKLQTENGAEFSLIRPLTKLKVGDTVQVAENYTDRTELRIWANAVVQSPPVWTFLAHANGREFYNITLDLLIVGGSP